MGRVSVDWLRLIFYLFDASSQRTFGKSIVNNLEYPDTWYEYSYREGRGARARVACERLASAPRRAHTRNPIRSMHHDFLGILPYSAVLVKLAITRLVRLWH